MESMHKIKDMLCNELEAFAKRTDLTTNNLDTINKLVVTIEKIDRIEEIEGGSDYSSRGYSRDGYSRGRYSRTDMSNNSYGNNSYGGNSYGHYVRGHYSRANGEDMGEIIEEMMQDPSTPQYEKETLRKAMEILQK